MKELLLFICLFGIVISNAQNNTNKHNDSKNYWLSCAKMLCDKTHDSESIATYNTLTDIATIFYDSNKYKIFDQSDNTHPRLFFLAITPEDTVINKSLIRNFVDLGVSGLFCFDTIFVSEYDNYSDLEKGIIVLHEGKHSTNVYHVQYNLGLTREYSEMCSYELENKVMKKYGGGEYEKILNREVSLFCYYSDFLNIKINTAFDPRIFPKRGYQPELDAIFGPALSETERNIREFQFYIHAVFQYIDENCEYINGAVLKMEFIKMAIPMKKY